MKYAFLYHIDAYSDAAHQSRQVRTVCSENNGHVAIDIELLFEGDGLRIPPIACDARFSRNVPTATVVLANDPRSLSSRI